MTPERWQRVKEIFSVALELDPAQRDEFVLKRCASDAMLLREVQSLLAAHAQPGTFLEPEAAAAARASVFSSSTDIGAGVASQDRTDERIGAYRIAGTLGSGGMGAVYKAVRDDDEYQAAVAIKLMRADMKMELIAQRFKIERQILAGLDHRNIARLLDGGTTGDGLPYVVMELVNGQPIDVYCSTHQLGIRDRVQLFLQVCSAVSYAHQQLVVHRDLKPTNILVTSDGSVKLLDFGIAKLLEAESITQPRDETATALRMMTLDYASPEQVTGGVITTVSDVYSLGVVLYKLLTGHSPHGNKQSQPQRVADILNDSAPVPPSNSISDRDLRRELRGDLDNILMMALRKEPQQRYGSVDQLANDLRHYLDGMPVHARGNALRYRAGKFVRRHGIEIAAVTLVVMAMISATAISLHEARSAEQQRQIAQRHFDSVRKLSNKLFEFHDEIANLQGATRARAMLVTTSLEYLDALYKEASTDRSLQQELGIAYRKVGDLQGNALGGNTGDAAASLASYDKAIALLEPLYESDSNNHEIGWQLARAYGQKSSTTYFTKGPEAAVAIANRALDLAESNQRGLAPSLERVKILGNGYWTKALIDGSLGNKDASMVAIDRMIAITEEYAFARPDDDVALNALSAAYSNASMIQDSRLAPEQKMARSIELLHKAEDADLRSLAIKPDKAIYKWSLAETRYNIGNTLCDSNHCGEAIESFRLAAPVLAERARDALDTHAQMLSLMANEGLAWALFSANQTAEVEHMLRDNQQMLIKLAHDYDNLQVKFVLARNQVRLGRTIALRARSTTDQLVARGQLTTGIAFIREINEMVHGDLGIPAVLKDAEAWLKESEQPPAPSKL